MMYARTRFGRGIIFFFGFGELYEGLKFLRVFRLRWEGEVVPHVRISFGGGFYSFFQGEVLMERYLHTLSWFRAMNW
jgi:hypothetical protein